MTLSPWKCAFQRDSSQVFKKTVLGSRRFMSQRVGERIYNCKFSEVTALGGAPQPSCLLPVWSGINSKFSQQHQNFLSRNLKRFGVILGLWSWSMQCLFKRFNVCAWGPRQGVGIWSVYRPSWRLHQEMGSEKPDYNLVKEEHLYRDPDPKRFQRPWFYLLRPLISFSGFVRT